MMEHDYCEPSVSVVNVKEENKAKQCYSMLHGNVLAQQFVQNVYIYFENRHPHLSSLQETSKALQISEFSVRRYKDGPLEERSVLSRKRAKPSSTDLRESSRVEIRNEIYSMYAERKSLTIKSLHIRLHEKEKYAGSLSSLLKVVKSLGFTYRNDDNRRALMERPCIADKRRRFLSAYMANEDLGLDKKPYVFLDETWIFSNGSVRRSWQDDSIKSVRKEKGDGYRYIVLHAGCQHGFIKNARLIFKSKSNKGDYHGEMNADNFETWISQSLLPNLDEPSIIILDNASYHTRQTEKWPTKKWLKADLQRWLTEKGVPFSKGDTVQVLWQHINQLPRAEKSFKVDELIQNAGHEVLRLPPYHCQFNAIEMVWSQAKRLYDQYILQEKDVTKAWEMALQGVSKEQWANYIRHTYKVIKAAWEKEQLIMVTIQEPIIINADDSDADFSDASE